jgi:hypothetical protein
MRFLTTWKTQPGTFSATIARFMESGGAPPSGVRMLHRWHGMNGTGIVVSESDDPKAIFQWVAQWADVIELNVTPCVDDADAGAVLATLVKR